MKFWIGTALLPFAIWLLWTAYRHWLRVTEARLAMPAGWDTATEDDTSPLSLAGFGEMVLPFVVVALTILAIQFAVLYRMFGGGPLMSLFDLCAALFTMAAYGLNFAVKVKCRMPKMPQSPSKGDPVPQPVQLRQPYAPDNNNPPYNHRQNRLSVVPPQQPALAALEQMQ
jgi:hypothetical protein